MKVVLVFLGILAWIGVGALAVLMADWDKPVCGYLPIFLSVLVAWAVGEYVSERLFRLKP